MVDRSENQRSPVFFTICSKNLLAYAKTYVASVKRNHPDSDVYIFLADRFLGPKDGLEDATIVTLEEHGGAYYRDMMFRYNITEFNTSIKPFCFLYLFDRYEKGTGIIYMDPDIWVHSPLLEVCDGFADGLDCIVTPHMTEPMGYSDLTDRGLLKYGAYNFGFVGISNTTRNEEIVCWWADELKENCTIDFQNGLFVDQKYGDLFPSFFEKTLILRDAGYNVAYWNLFSRTLMRNDDGSINVNEYPLRFLHFSGASTSDNSPVISRHCQYLTKGTKQVYGELMVEWFSIVDSNMHDLHLKQGYSFFWDNVDKGNEHTPQSRTDDHSVIPFERSHWMFMNQFVSVGIYSDWLRKEENAIQSHLRKVDEVRKLEGKSLFCNQCMGWSLVSDWTHELDCPCGASMLDRLVHAFMYQELKVTTEYKFVMDQEEFGRERISKSKYLSRADLVSSTLNYSNTETEDVLGITYQGVEFLSELSKSMQAERFTPHVIGIDDLGNPDTLQELDFLMKEINNREGVRASLFTGMSINHFVLTGSVGFVYVEYLERRNLEESSFFQSEEPNSHSLASAA